MIGLLLEIIALTIWNVLITRDLRKKAYEQEMRDRFSALEPRFGFIHDRMDIIKSTVACDGIKYAELSSKISALEADKKCQSDDIRRMEREFREWYEPDGRTCEEPPLARRVAELYKYLGVKLDVKYSRLTRTPSEVSVVKLPKEKKAAT